MGSPPEPHRLAWRQPSRPPSIQRPGVLANLNREDDVIGRVVQLSRKPERANERGLPKVQVPELRLTPAGVEGDFNRWRTEKAAGDPDQAVLLVTDETLEQLRREGWPVQRGDLGENVTVSGIPESAWHEGAQVRLGSALLEISKPCPPCTLLYTLSYVGEERGPEFIRTMRGRRGWFARVLRAGQVRAGAPVELIARFSPAPVSS